MNRDLPATILFLWKLCFSFRTSYKELIWCTNHPNVHIYTFCKSWSFIWGWFFPMTIFNSVSLNKYVLLFLVRWNLCSCSKFFTNFQTVASETHWKENILFNLNFCLILKVLRWLEKFLTKFCALSSEIFNWEVQSNSSRER